MRKSKPRRLKTSSTTGKLKAVFFLALATGVLMLILCYGAKEGAFLPPDSLTDAAFNGTHLGSSQGDYTGVLAAPPSTTPEPSYSPTDQTATNPTATPDPSTTASDSPSPDPSVTPSAVDTDPSVHTVTVTADSSSWHANYDGVFVKNETNYELDIRSYLESELPESVRKAPQHIIIIHTHSSEAFYPDGEDIYEPTDVQRTEDTNYNVVRLGDALADKLTERGFKVTHIREIFDYPSYTGSYTRALAALEAAIAENPDACSVIDIHRDAITSASGSIYRVVDDTPSGRAAQMMLVVGTDSSGLAHDNWRRNLTFAVHLQKYIVDEYPNLMRPIALSRSRYNQHLTEGSLIVEVGASGNTLREALLSIELFGEKLCDFFDDIAE